MTERAGDADQIPGSTEITVAYGPHRDQNAIVTFPPAGMSPAPLVLLFHGGFWRQRWDREHLRGPAAQLSAQGYVVANIEYRRVGDDGDGGWPNTLIDAATATDTLADLIESRQPGRIDAGSVVTVGHSAGGHLAVWSALRAQLPADSPGWVATPARLAGAIALAGAVDLTEADRLGEGNGAVAEFLGGGPADVPDRYAAADPALLGKPSVPIVLIHGERDDVLHVEMSRSYAERFGADLVEIPGGGHMEVIDPESAAWQLLLGALERLVGTR